MKDAIQSLERRIALLEHELAMHRQLHELKEADFMTHLQHLYESGANLTTYTLEVEESLVKTMNEVFGDPDE